MKLDEILIIMTNSLSNIHDNFVSNMYRPYIHVYKINETYEIEHNTLDDTCTLYDRKTNKEVIHIGNLIDCEELSEQFAGYGNRNVLILLPNSETGVIINRYSTDKFIYTGDEDIKEFGEFNINEFEESTYFQISTIHSIIDYKTLNLLKENFHLLKKYTNDLKMEIYLDLNYNIFGELCL